MAEYKVWVAHYPEAPRKIVYYENIMSELEGYETAANNLLDGITQDNKRQDTEEGNNGAGPYFDIFIAKKNLWFDKLDQMKADLSSDIAKIHSGWESAKNKRDYWEIKSHEGHWE